MTVIKVLIADDHALLREGLRRILQMEPDIDVVGEAGDADEAIAQAGNLQPDVILMDINMPKGGGLAATRGIQAAHPEIDIIALTIHEDDEYVFELVNAGAKGYMLKDSDPARVVDAIRRVREGGSFMPPHLMSKVLMEFRRLSQGAGPSQRFSGNEPPPDHEPLTEREREILQLIVNGHTNREIADALFISEKTVKNHVTNVLRKLELHDRTQAAVYAVRHGMVEL